MTLTEMINAVATRTKRPDLEDDIFIAIQEATLKVHLSDFFDKDLIELPFAYNPPLANGQVIQDSAFPNFRNICYWRKFDPSTKALGIYLTPVSPSNLIGYFGEKKLDVYYVAGKVINWSSSCADAGHLVGYWRYPDVSRSNYDSWIARTYAFPIVNWAVSKIFRTVGQQDESRAAVADYADSFLIVQMNEVRREGP